MAFKYYYQCLPNSHLQPIVQQASMSSSPLNSTCLQPYSSFRCHQIFSYPCVLCHREWFHQPVLKARNLELLLTPTSLFLTTPIKNPPQVLLILYPKYLSNTLTRFHHHYYPAHLLSLEILLLFLLFPCLYS